MSTSTVGFPWYFLTTIFSRVFDSIFQWIVMYFFDEEKVENWLQQSITISDITPWVIAFIINSICLIIYIHRLKSANQIENPEDKILELNKIMSKIVNEYEYIESMQAFQYNLKNTSKEKYIKLSFLTGVASEGIEINAILQTYYYFSHSLYKKISIVAGNYERYIKETDPNKRHAYQTNFQESGLELCNLILDNLNKIKDVDEITDLHCDSYRTLAKLFPSVSGNPIESFLQNSEIETALIKRKRNGILGAILVNELYIFKNQTSMSKSDRIYFVFPYNCNTKRKKGDKIVLLGSINGSCFTSNDSNDIKIYCENVLEDIFNEKVS